MNNQRPLTLLAVLTVFAGGCGQNGAATTSSTGKSVASASSPQSVPASHPQYATPVDAYGALAKATKDKSWKLAATVLTPDTQTMMAGALIMGASFATIEDQSKEQELKKLLARHGIDLDAENSEPSADEEYAGPEAMMKAMTAPIKDLPTFVGEIGDWIENNTDGDQGGFAVMGDLGEVTIEGDAAHATSQTDMGPQPIEFRKINGSWLVHLPTDGPRGDSSDASFDRDDQLEDDGTPSLGALWYGDKAIKLRHAVAYRSKFFDDPCIVVLLTAEPIYERDRNRLKKILREEAGDDVFFASGPNVKLSLDENGKLLSMFAWVDNMSINRNNGVDVDVQFDGDHVTGAAAMAEADAIAEKPYRFDAKFDVTLMQP